MATVSVDRALDAWDRGQHLDDVGRALTLLTAADPATDPDVLARLPIGARDARLFELRAAWFGDRASATVTCPRCDATVEFEFSISDLPAAHGGRDRGVVVQVADRRLQCRPPDSHALRAAADADGERAARRAVVRACTVRMEPDGTVDDLSDADLVEVGRQLEQVHPAVDQSIEVVHAECGASFGAVLAVDVFLWAELDSWAHRTLDDVHRLALRYGWSEPDILSLSPQRRRRYLEMAAS